MDRQLVFAIESFFVAMREVPAPIPLIEFY
jgi:hypothetical protein